MRNERKRTQKTANATGKNHNGKQMPVSEGIPEKVGKSPEPASHRGCQTSNGHIKKLCELGNGTTVPGTAHGGLAQQHALNAADTAQPNDPCQG